MHPLFALDQAVHAWIMHPFFTLIQKRFHWNRFHIIEFLYAVMGVCMLAGAFGMGIGMAWLIQHSSFSLGETLLAYGASVLIITFLLLIWLGWFLLAENKDFLHALRAASKEWEKRGAARLPLCIQRRQQFAQGIRPFNTFMEGASCVLVLLAFLLPTDAFGQILALVYTAILTLAFLYTHAFSGPNVHPKDRRHSHWSPHAPTADRAP